MERKPLKASLKCGDRVLIPCGRVEDECGNTVRILYDELLIAAGSCRVEYFGVLHVRVDRSCKVKPSCDNIGDNTI